MGSIRCKESASFFEVGSKHIGSVNIKLTTNLPAYMILCVCGMHDKLFTNIIELERTWLAFHYSQKTHTIMCLSDSYQLANIIVLSHHLVAKPKLKHKASPAQLDKHSY